MKIPFIKSHNFVLLLFDDADQNISLYMMDKSLKLPSLNKSQQRAVDEALRKPFTVIQGPPGTYSKLLEIFGSVLLRISVFRNTILWSNLKWSYLGYFPSWTCEEWAYIPFNLSNRYRENSCWYSHCLPVFQQKQRVSVHFLWFVQCSSETAKEACYTVLWTFQQVCGHCCRWIFMW